MMSTQDSALYRRLHKKYEAKLDEVKTERQQNVNAELNLIEAFFSLSPVAQFRVLTYIGHRSAEIKGENDQVWAVTWEKGVVQAKREASATEPATVTPAPPPITPGLPPGEYVGADYSALAGPVTYTVLTVAEASKVTGINKVRIHRAIKDRKLKSARRHRIHGRKTTVVDRAEVEAYFAKKTTKRAKK